MFIEWAVFEKTIIIEQVYFLSFTTFKQDPLKYSSCLWIKTWISNVSNLWFLKKVKLSNIIFIWFKSSLCSQMRLDGNLVWGSRRNISSFFPPPCPDQHPSSPLLTDYHTWSLWSWASKSKVLQKSITVILIDAL